MSLFSTGAVSWNSLHVDLINYRQLNHALDESDVFFMTHFPSEGALILRVLVALVALI